MVRTTKRSLALLVCLLAFAAIMPGPAIGSGGGWPGSAPYSVPTDEMDRALACHGGKAALDGKETLQPVLLVHGTGVTREQNWEWNYWIALPDEGFEVCWVQLPDAALDDIQIAAEYVARAVQVMHKKTGEKIDILGHSQGGIEPRWAIKFFPSGRFVADYIALASPNHGTVVANESTSSGQANPAVWQMRTDARLIRALNTGDETPGPIYYTNIYTVHDELVQPVGTQALAGGANILLQDLCPERPVDHVSIAGDGLTYLLVIDALTEPGPAKIERLPADHCRATSVPGSSAPPPGSSPDYSSGRFTDHEPRLKPYAR